MEEGMNDQRSLILMMYAGFALVILLGGFIYKEIRDFREHRRKPRQLNFNVENDTAHEHENEHELATHHS
jgi:ABC-type nickel/cobalt efflux system permease component RcnA